MKGRRRVWIVIGLLAILVLLKVVGPYEDATLDVDFDEAALGTDADAYFAKAESNFNDITPGVEKRIVWAEGPGTYTKWAVLYIHGFSATSEEIRPVPDLVANALGANLVFTRLQGHGRGSDAMGEATVAGWMKDTAEALAVARMVGQKVLVISTSTGGTLLAAAAQDENMMQSVAGTVFVAPNFGLNSSLASILTWPAARYWLPLIAGKTRSFEPHNADHEKYWTTSYPSTAVLPMAALVKKVVALDHGNADVPALFWFSNEDQVISPDAARKVASRWGGPSQTVNPELTDADDPYAHVIAGKTMSPGQTDATVKGILDWAKGL